MFLSPRFLIEWEYEFVEGMIHTLLFRQKLNGLLQYIMYMLAKLLDCYQLILGSSIAFGTYQF